MLKGIANGFNKLADGTVKLDRKVKEMELLSTSERIQAMRVEMQQLQEREARLMMELGGVSVVIVNGKAELA